MVGRVHQPAAPERTGVREWEPYEKWYWHEPVGYCFAHGWAELGRCRQLRATDFRVWCGLLACCDWQNRVLVSFAHVARVLGYARQTVMRSLARLVACRLVTVQKAPGARQWCVTLTPEVLWRGRPRHLAAARAQFEAEWQLLHGPAAADDPPRPSRRASPPRGVTARRRPAPFPSPGSLPGVRSVVG